MRSNKYTIIALSAILAVTMLLIMLMPTRVHHDWDMDRSPSESGFQPYDITLLDSLLSRSLDSGYSICPISVSDDDLMLTYIDGKPYNYISEIANAPTDTSLMVIQYSTWHTPEDERVMPVLQLMMFAQQGGRALLVFPDYSWEFNYLFDDLNLHWYVSSSYDPGSVYTDYRERQYTPKWFAPEYQPITLVSPHQQPITIDHRLCYYHFDFHEDITQNISVTCCNLDPDNDDPQDVRLSAMLTESQDKHIAYALEIFYPESGGRLYISFLGLPFTNMGLTSDGAHQVVSQLVSRIDNKPVVRLEYHQTQANKWGLSKTRLLNKIKDNDALHFAWILMFVLAALVLSRGLMRRHPAIRGIEAEDIDRTDAMAVREYQFRKSPLLHFLYQCSWLYNGANDYRELLDINYRRLARIVSRNTNVELTSATDDELRKAADLFAAKQGRSVNTVYDELKWMQSFGINYQAKVSPKQYAYSQSIIEYYQ